MQRDGTLGFVRQSLLCIHSHLVCYTEASERAPLLLLNHAPPLARLPCQDGAPGEQLDLWAAPCGAGMRQFAPLRHAAVPASAGLSGCAMHCSVVCWLSICCAGEKALTKLLCQARHQGDRHLAEGADPIQLPQLLQPQ